MKKAVFTAVLFICSAVFFGCKSSERVQPEPVELLALLDEDSSIYMSIPASKNAALVSRLLCSRISGLSEKDARLIAERTDSLYAGLGTVGDRSRIQVVSDTSVPKIALNSALSKKNGWKKSAVSYGVFTFEKFTQDSGSFELAVSPFSIFCAAQDVEPLLRNYASRTAADDTAWNSWIGEETDEIRFFITKPGQYLRGLIGQSVSGVESVYGSLRQKAEEKPAESYVMSFYMRLADSRAVPALRALLGLSFAMAGGSVSQTDSYTLMLSGVEVSASQIESLFSRDPITGKHYKVEGDAVIEESVPKK